MRKAYCVVFLIYTDTDGKALANNCDVAFELMSFELLSLDLKGSYIVLCNSTLLLHFNVFRNS